jgi:hypothetical protein
MKDKAKASGVQLGQEAFLVTTADGQVERTMVGELDTMGYRFLNGCSVGRGHCFSFDQAIALADAHLKQQEVKLRASLRALGKRRKYLQSAEYKDEVMAAPYKVVDLRQVEKRKRTRQIKKVSVPEQYVIPGCLVYVVITPSTRYRFEGYRPFTHFVLQTMVSTVCICVDGGVHYTFTTPFVVEDFFLSKDMAMKNLFNLSKSGKLEATGYVSHEEERKHLLEDDLPF